MARKNVKVRRGGSTAIPASVDVLGVGATASAGAVVGSNGALALTTLETSVTQYGITWTFSEPCPVGQYCNGDYFVVGPVTVTAISPVPSSGRNGTMLNPVANVDPQGFDSRMSDGSYSVSYSDVANDGLSLPLVISTPVSMVSSISNVTPVSDGLGGPAQPVNTYATLTVVDAVPPLGAFRPSTASSDKTSRWKEADIQYDRLRSLAPVAGAPDLAATNSPLSRARTEFFVGFQGRITHATTAGAAYGQYIAWQTNDAALLLHLNYTNEQKRDLCVNLIQFGIEVAGVAETLPANGGNNGDNKAWGANGGQKNGRKVAVVYAATLLQEAGLLAIADGVASQRDVGEGPTAPLFGEDSNTWYISAADIGRVGYLAGDVGVAEWGIRHSWESAQDNRAWDTPYRYNGSVQAPAGLAVMLLDGGKAAWNWPQFFDWCDRYYLYQGPDSASTNPYGNKLIGTDGINDIGGTNGMKQWWVNMWEAYRGLV